MPNSRDNYKTNVIHDFEAAHVIAQLILDGKNQIDLCIDFNMQHIDTIFESSKHAIYEAKRRGIKIRCITEITKHNISYCKELVEIVDLRHLDGLTGNFAVNNSECATIASVQQNQPMFQIIHSNNAFIVKQQQYLFEVLWEKAFPSEDRIKEIENGIIVRDKIRVLETQDAIVKAGTDIIDNSNELEICSTTSGFRSAHDAFLDALVNASHRHKAGEHKGVRWITTIHDDILELVELFIQLGFDVRHLEDLPPLNFGVSDKEIFITLDGLEGQIDKIENALISNKTNHLEHFKFIFERLWKNSINAKDRIRDIQEGIEPAEIEIIRSPREALRRAWEITRASSQEILQIYSTPNAVRRQIKLVGLEVFRDAILGKTPSAPNVRILIPYDEGVDHIVRQVNEQLPQMSVRVMDASLRTNITIHIVDRNQCMIFELKDDSKEDSFDAVGVTIYSDSKTIVSSYVAIFESLWKQTELYEHIKEVNSKYLILNRELSTAYDKLKMQEKMQKEFINIAAHELKTPIMPIMAVSEMIESKLRGGKKKVFLDSRRAQIVIRNAKRLEQLSQDILDITRIESNTLRLRKQRVNIKEIIYALLQDFGNQLIERNIKINRKHVEDIFVEADKERLNQVIANLLNNAIKFTENGVITITARKQNSSSGSPQHTNKRWAIVSIKDTGYGIDQEVLTKLFSKFATKSEKGMGLGLYISKNIIEAHGGRIWAENNIDGKGATLTFTIPIRSQQNESRNNDKSSVGEVAPAVEAD